MSATKLIFVGGFLGSGKTTLLYELNRILKNRGIQTGLITNDQAPNLVDTALLQHDEMNIAEVTGSCFCCDFKSLRKAIGKVNFNQKTDIIIAEPVGSCTDLAATLINPIREMMQEEVRVSPLTVLADPGRLKDILGEGDIQLHPAAAYIIRKQLEESDIIAITKTDLYDREEIEALHGKLKTLFPACDIRTISAKTGEGIEEWIESVLTGENAGRHILDIDYDRYAQGEAVLGWLNCSVALSGENTDWDHFSHRFMQSLADTFDNKNLTVGHVKCILENGDLYTTGNLTGSADTLTFRWSAGKSDNASLIVNARVETSPEILKNIFLVTLEQVAKGSVSFKINNIRSISPGYPNPTYRFKKK